MEPNSDHINRLITEKLNSFEPAPPPHVWEGVLAGLEANQKAMNRRKTVRYAAAALLVVLLSTLGWFLLSDATIENSVTSKDLLVESKTSSIGVPVQDIETNDFTQTSQLNNPELNENDGVELVELAESEPKPLAQSAVVKPNYSTDNKGFLDSKTVLSPPKIRFTSHQSDLLFRKTNGLNSANKELISQNTSNTNELDLGNPTKEKKTKVSYWTAFTGLSAEFAITSFDSVTMLNSYTLHFEPTLYLNKNWFVRSGIGVSYAHDRGFAKLDYISNDYMGTYNDVYNVTFDSVNGQVVPTYHTKTVEVWDSVRHLVVSEVTNRYAYIQIPLLLGYYHQARNSGLNWYVYGGPAINIQAGRTIEEPNPAGQYIEILSLQNRLPERNKVYYQLWFGVGAEYKLNDRFSVAIEPGYRYYLNTIYNKEGYKKPISAFSIKVGAVLRLK